jgi:tRNA(fMet)-specific endonuclease VapC
MRCLLDTNVISELVAKQPNQRVIEWIDSSDAADLYLSVVTIGELRKGIEKLPDSLRKDTLLSWLTNDLALRFYNRILTIDIGVMMTWGAFAGSSERKGRVLPAMDSLIAAICLHHECALATRNVEDFAGTEVVVVNPWL